MLPRNELYNSAGTYLTNGNQLFRVARVLTGRVPTLELEDCLTLDVQLVTEGDLARMCLRVVTSRQPQLAGK